MEQIAHEAKGFRDVYWCGALNEPVIVSYPFQGKTASGVVVGDDSTPICTHCDGKVLWGDHQFMFHILKPTKPEASLAEKMEFCDRHTE